MIDKETNLFFSVAAKPGNLGCTVYNELFKHYKINAIYKPLKCETKEEFPELIRSLRTIKASGVSVSMPFKILARQLINTGNYLTSQIGNANTIDLVNNKSYNTDYYGFGSACSFFGTDTKRSIVITGDGALSKTIQYYLSKIGENFEVLKREHLYLLNEPIFYHNKLFNLYLINTIPVGMDGIPDDIFTKKNTENFVVIVNAVINPGSNLEKLADQHDASYISGLTIFKHQLVEQFNIYCGFKPEIYVIDKILKDYNLQ